MLGFGDKHHVDPTKLPIFVHAIQSKEAFELAQKVWQANQRYLRLDSSNRKELLRFVFANPPCVVWLQRDQGRTDTVELVLLWDNEKEEVSEVYVISAATGTPVGDDARAKSLLSSILSSPATVPASER